MVHVLYGSTKSKGNKQKGRQPKTVNVLMIPYSKGTHGTNHCQNWPSRLIQPERECPARSVNA